MYNYILDRLPDAYEGYLIRTDFRIGVQINMALTDTELSNFEKQCIALGLLYGCGIPSDINLAVDGLSWFMNGGTMPGTHDEEDGPRSFDFQIDGTRIWSGFRRVYGLDLSRERLHWFHFLGMISDLGECAFTDVIGYRVAKIDKLPKDMQADYRRLKKMYELPEILDDESQEATDKFMSLLNG